MPTEPSSTDVPFLDPGPVSDPEVDAAEAATVSPETTEPTVVASSPGPCEDCARYARIGYVAGVVIGVAAGGVCAWIILRNRLSPVTVDG